MTVNKMNKLVKNIGKGLGLTILASMLFVNPVNAQENQVKDQKHQKPSISYLNFYSTDCTPLSRGKSGEESVLMLGIGDDEYMIADRNSNDKPDFADVTENRVRYELSTESIVDRFYGNFYRRIVNGLVKNYCNKLREIIEGEVQPKVFNLFLEKEKQDSDESREVANLYAIGPDNVLYAFRMYKDDFTLLDFDLQDRDRNVNIKIKNNFPEKVQEMLSDVFTSLTDSCTELNETVNEYSKKRQEEILNQLGY